MALVVLAWVGGIAFFWSELGATLVLGYESDFYLRALVALALLAMVTNKSCSCCCGRACCDKCMVEEGKREM